jgi:hypothetical protein
MYEIINIEVEKKSPLAKYQSSMANLIEVGVALQNFVSFLWVLGQISRAESQVTFCHPHKTPES